MTITKWQRERVADRSPAVLAPRVTGFAAAVIVTGVIAQGALAGGFLAGHPGLTDIHMSVGIPLVVSSLVMVGVGLIGRRRRREPTSVLATRLAVLVTLLTTGIVGMVAAAGTRDLLIVHIPLALISMGLAARLAATARSGSIARTARTRDPNQ